MERGLGEEGPQRAGLILELKGTPCGDNGKYFSVVEGMEPTASRTLGEHFATELRSWPENINFFARFPPPPQPYSGTPSPLLKILRN